MSKYRSNWQIKTPFNIFILFINQLFIQKYLFRIFSLKANDKNLEYVYIAKIP